PAFFIATFSLSEKLIFTPFMILIYFIAFPIIIQWNIGLSIDKRFTDLYYRFNRRTDNEK
ncbi:hypothetical protein, partial [Proteus mirabilis]|uniref:hypothetical protein n=1 Tax=Proteus mirabilis TaxID=584 RepID=UPI001ADD877A